MKRKNNVAKIGKKKDGMPRPKNNKFYPHECGHKDKSIIESSPEQVGYLDIQRCDDCGVDFDIDGKTPIGPGTSEMPPQAEQKPVMVSHGEYLVGTYESGGNPEVEWYKKHSAEIIDRLTAIMDSGDDGAGRCAAIALSKYEEACMWAVKAVTKPPTPV